MAKSYDVSMSAFSKALAKVAGFMMVGSGVWAHSQSRRQHVDRPEMNRKAYSAFGPVSTRQKLARLGSTDLVSVSRSKESLRGRPVVKVGGVGEGGTEEGNWINDFSQFFSRKQRMLTFLTP